MIDVLDGDVIDVHVAGGGKVLPKTIFEYTSAHVDDWSQVMPDMPKEKGILPEEFRDDAAKYAADEKLRKEYEMKLYQALVKMRAKRDELERKFKNGETVDLPLWELDDKDKDAGNDSDSDDDDDETPKDTKTPAAVAKPKDDVNSPAAKSNDDVDMGDAAEVAGPPADLYQLSRDRQQELNGEEQARKEHDAARAAWEKLEAERDEMDEDLEEEVTPPQGPRVTGPPAPSQGLPAFTPMGKYRAPSKVLNDQSPPEKDLPNRGVNEPHQSTGLAVSTPGAPAPQFPRPQGTIPRQSTSGKKSWRDRITGEKSSSMQRDWRRKPDGGDGGSAAA